MANSHSTTDSFKIENLVRSETTESDDIGEFVSGRLPSPYSSEKRLGDHKFQDNG